MKKSRKVSAVITAAAASAAALYAYATGIMPPAANVVGSFASLVLFLIAAEKLGTGDRLFYSGLIFVFMATSLGSVVNLYRTADSYDKIVHFASGMLLAAFGELIGRKVLCTKKKCDSHTFLLPLILITFMFSSASAGLWEIFEFAADRLAGGGMQRGMVDTVTDMIAGNAGAVIYTGVMYFMIHEKTENNKSEKG